MKDNLRKRIFIILLILVAILLIIFIALSQIFKEKNVNKGVNGENTIEDQYENNKSDIDLKGSENVDITNSGSTKNISEELKKDKKVADLDITNINVVYNNSETQITGVITNNTLNEINANFVNVKILNQDGSVFTTINVYIGKVKSGATKSLNIVTQADVSNMKDIIFEIE